jgi:hypothetical protein
MQQGPSVCFIAEEHCCLLPVKLWEGISPTGGVSEGGQVMRDLSTKQWADFTAKVETLCGEFIHAIERDRYSPAEVIQAACNVIAAAIDETGDKDLAIRATQRWINTSLERARAVDQMRHSSRLN